MVKSLLLQVLSFILSPAVSLSLCSFPNSTMVEASLCMTVISFYDVAMSGPLSLPLGSACRFMTLLSSGQLVYGEPPPPLIPPLHSTCCQCCPARSFQTSAESCSPHPLCTAIGGNARLSMKYLSRQKINKLNDFSMKVEA